MMEPALIEKFVGGKRFLEVRGYRFDRLLFGIYILTLLGVFVVAFLLLGSDKSQHIYFNCDQSICENPFFHNYPLCEQVWIGACVQETVPGGFEFGVPVPWIVKYWGVFVGAGLLFVFILNHWIHNRRFRFDKLELET